MNKRQKKKLTKMKNKKIIKRYPWLLPRNVFTDKLPDDYDYSYTLADCFPNGWRKAFFTEMHEEIRDELIRCNYLNKFRVMDIKEKYAQLCYYVGGIPMNCIVYEIIRKYEYISQYTCIDCGKIDVPVIDNGWLTPICEKCYDQRERRIAKFYEKRERKYSNTTSYKKLLEKITHDYTLKDYYEIKRNIPGGGWETVRVDISDTVNKLRKNKG